jgi:hypothetical protein
MNEYGAATEYTDGRKLKNSEENLSQCHSVHHKSHWTDLEMNPGCGSEKPATNRLSYGMANFRHYTQGYLICNYFACRKYNSVIYLHL